MDNYELITKGFRIVRDALAPYIARELLTDYGQDWWQEAVIDRLFDDQKRSLPSYETLEEVTKSLDVAICLTLFDIHWNQTFKKKLAKDYRTWANELHGTRNKWAHIGGDTFSDSDTWRALDTMSRFLGGIDTEAEAKINEMLREFRYGSKEGSTASDAADASSAGTSTILEPTVAAVGLPSWRTIMQPHQDVAEGRYKNAEFAVDLAQIARGEGSFEYRDPVEFFSRTYVTEGMKGLLVQALRRVGGLDGEPVIQLKTAFGGGKTHSMLALYHLLRSKSLVDRIPNAQAVVQASGIRELPDVKVAVLVGTAYDPTQKRRPNDMPGITINTLWGEMVAQLSKASGDWSLFNYIKTADAKGVSPGSEALKLVFDSCGPCLILMDELVAYARKLYGAKDLPAGTFENFISFIQELSEAARASRDSLVVASIPESDIEVGGEAGRQALEAIEHTFGRMEAIWKPVTANEGFEVVRRRLFLPCRDEVARDSVCNAFSQMYNASKVDFPIDACELEYRDRMVACYPIHPEVFDRLYEDWATLERFQRTRGVLRLMAGVIHELWMGNDPSPMIMPGSFPLDSPPVRDELTRHLDEGWNGVVDSEIDGRKSLPFRKDKENPRYAQVMACRRVSRTIMLGSAPDVRGQNARGQERAHIRLGVVQPGENISVFNDALSTLQAASSYLYSDGSDNRYWYDTRPTLRKIVEDRAQLVKDEDAFFEIEGRLKKFRRKEPFIGIHVCPASSLDVPDEQNLRLVILPPSATMRSGNDELGKPGLKSAKEILASRGTSPRVYKNMLVFAAPDSSVAPSLRDDAKRYLAWKSIDDDRVTLNLDQAQQREATANIQRSSQLLDGKIEEAYSWLLVPSIDLLSGSQEMVWEETRIQGSGEDAVTKAARKMINDETAIAKWAPALLRMELDRLLWKDRDHIQIKELWGYLCTYPYLPRLSNYSVLEAAITSGLKSEEYFGVAAGVGENRYLELSLGTSRIIGLSDYLVKPSVARKQLEEEVREKPPVVTTTPPSGDNEGEGKSGGTTEPSKPAKSDPKRFSMTAELDSSRTAKSMQAIMEEIVSVLNAVPDAKVELSLDVRVTSQSGFPANIVRAVSENCNTLKISDWSFDE